MTLSLQVKRMLMWTVSDSQNESNTKNAKTSTLMPDEPVRGFLAFLNATPTFLPHRNASYKISIFFTRWLASSLLASALGWAS